MRVPKQLYILSLFFFLALCPGTIQADLDMHVLPGFDGYHKHGRWLPLRITLTSGEEDITGEIALELQDSTAGGRQIYSVPVTLSKATSKMQYLYALPESFRRNLQIRLISSSGRTILERNASLAAIPPEDILIVVISRNGSGLEFLTDTSEQDTSSTLEESDPVSIHVSYIGTEILPDKWKGYDSVDMMVLGDAPISALSASQQQAIKDWVYDGGKLVVSGGAHSQELLGTFVEQLLPVRINGTRVLNSISALPGFDRTSTVVASSEMMDDGNPIAIEGDGLPIIAEREVGSGKVVFLAFDYLDPAFLTWDGKKEMWEALLPQTAARKNPIEGDIARLLTASRAARLPSYKLVGFFLLLYVLCFGPLNYLILMKSNRDKLTWLTMPVISAVFIVCSLGLVYTTRSKTASVNDFSVVRFYQDAGRVRISSYFSLIPPARSDYRIDFPASEGMFVEKMQLSYRETSQDGDCRLIEKGTFQMEITRMDTATSQLFHGESYADLGGSVSINLLEDSEGVINGEVKSDLPFDLTDCYIFSKGYRFYIGGLARGSHSQVRLDQAHTGDISDLYSTRSGEKRRFIRALKPVLTSHIHGTWIAGWMEESALKTLARMSMGADYRALGMALVIVRL